MSVLQECVFCGVIRPPEGFKGGLQFAANVGTFYECAECMAVFESRGGKAFAQSTLLTAAAMRSQGLGRAEIRKMADLVPLTTGAAN